MSRIFETEVAGRKLSLEFGKVAELANGSVIVRYGDTVVVTAATASAKPTVEPTPSTVPSVKPSAGQGSTGENVDTGDSSDYILTALVAVFVMSVAVFALTTMKKKEN